MSLALAAAFVLASTGCATSPKSASPAAASSTETETKGLLGHRFVLKSPPHPFLGRVWDAREKAWVSEEALRAQLLNARFVLLGETHDNPDHHALQARVLSLLVESGRRPAVVFEMVDRSKQPILDEASTSNLTADALAQRLGWEKSGWPDFALYRPIFEVALRAKLPLVAGNLPLEDVRTIVQKGAAVLTPDQKRTLVDAPLPTAADRALRDELVESHCGHLPASMLDTFVLAQRARDLEMAERLLEAGKENGAVLIAGAGHLRNDYGVPHYLAASSPGPVVALAFLERAHGNEDETKDTSSLHPPADLPYDLVAYTPRLERSDPCEGLESRMKKAASKSAPAPETTPAPAASTPAQ